MFDALFTTTTEYKKLSHALSGKGACALFGLPASGRAQVYAALCRQLDKPLCIVTPGEAEATRFAADLNTLGIPAAVFPARDYVLRPIEGTAREYEYRRLAVLGELVGGRLRAVAVPAEALTQFTTPKEDFCANTRTLHAGDTLLRDDLLAALFGAGYTRRAQVDGPGQFSVRGDIVDIFAPDQKMPVRMEFWGDEIDTLHTFDLTTQRREDAIDKFYLSPAREVLFGKPADAAEQLRAFLAKQRGKKKTAMADCMAADLDLLDGGAVPVNMDKYLAVRYPHPATVLDYFDDPILVAEEPASIREADRATDYRRGEELKSLILDGVLCAGLDNLYADPSYLWSKTGHYRTICAENFARSMPDQPLKDIINAPAHTLPAWNGEVAGLLEDLKPLCDAGYTVTLLAGTDRAAAGLARDLRDKGILVTTDAAAAPAAGLVQVLAGHLSAGCEFPFAKYALLTGRAFGETSSQKKKRKKAKDALNSLTEITPGDLVVHQNHGIGRYAGIQRMAVQGVTKDYLRIEYDKKDVLYVPVTQLDLLSRYTAPGDSENVKLSRLGGAEWTKTRKKVRAATEQMAKELIELYARRKRAHGHAFPPDDTWQGDFEQRFAYDETPDQLSSAAEIKHDMEQPWPMDRLLCGDVGFGKTEVALRAVMKCILAGKQAAILVPTTVLARQHYLTAMQRFQGHPITIELLTRYKTGSEQTALLKKLEAGSVDLVIGTHKLFNKKIKFKDLGLLVVDEEQRFGVGHKETLKEMSKNVDVLTLSATPIPRTLNMALSGIRDMSSIEEPPQNRHPVQTFVLEQNDGVLLDAIRRELGRGGQVYYLHNRVESIERCASMWQQRLPDARIGIVHGKMGQKEIAKVMNEMADGEIDILVCTTIIETGIDIPNANTLIIENADNMGLAQLHQIRGRVGRSSRHAYAYLCYRHGKALSEIAQKRLGAIREFAAFGSGFKIAMRDLEIRGAGNVLGPEQSGHMMSVGYDLYLKLLEEAVQEEKGETPKPRVDCAAELLISANLPADYVADAGQRVDLYRRIALIRTDEQRSDMLDELIDRFGEPPAEAIALLDIALLRAKASEQGIAEIKQQDGRLLLTFSETDFARLSALCGDSEFKGRLLLNAGSTPYLSLRLNKGETAMEMAQTLVDKYAATVK